MMLFVQLFFFILSLFIVKNKAHVPSFAPTVQHANIIYTPVPPLNDDPFNTIYYNVASSSNGSFICAISCDDEGFSCDLSISSNYGATWITTWSNLPDAVSGQTLSISDTGEYIVVGTLSGYNFYLELYLSSDFGKTFVAVTSNIPNQAERPIGNLVTTSGTGEYMYVTSYYSGNGNSLIYKSSDYGNSWTSSFSGPYPLNSDDMNTPPTSCGNFESTYPGQTFFPMSIANSESGNYVYATYCTGLNHSYVYISSSYGSTWTQSLVPLVAPFVSTSIATSQLGQYVVVTFDKQIYLSSSYGSYWTLIYSSSSQIFTDITLSASGQYLAATSSTGLVYSISFGSFVYNSISSSFTWISSSSDGQKLVMVGGSSIVLGQYTEQPSSKPSSQPSRQPSTQPSTQPSRQPSSRPSANPTNYYGGLNQTQTLVVAQSSINSINDTQFPLKYSNLGNPEGRMFYLDVVVITSSLVQSNGQSIVFSFSPVVGSSSPILTSGGDNFCYVPLSCSSTSYQCLYNIIIDTDAYWSSVDGGTINVQVGGNYGSNSNIVAPCNSIAYSVKVTISSTSIPTQRPTMIPTSSNVTTETEVIYEPNTCSSTNSSSHLEIKYIYITFSLVFLFTGIMLYVVRRQSENIVQISVFSIIFQISLNGIDMISDILYLIFLIKGYFIGLSSTSSTLAMIMVFCRVLHPGVTTYFCYVLLRPINQKFKMQMDDVNLSLYAKEYGLLMFITILESSSLKFFPWLTTEFSSLSGGYPNILFFNLVTYSKLVQSLLSSIVQTVIFSMKKLKVRNIECEIIIVFTYISSVAVLILSFFEIVFQRKVLVTASSLSSSSSSSSSSPSSLSTSAFTRDTELVVRIDDSNSNDSKSTTINPLQTRIQYDNKDAIIEDLMKQLHTANQTIIELQKKVDGNTV